MKEYTVFYSYIGRSGYMMTSNIIVTAISEDEAKAVAITLIKAKSISNITISKIYDNPTMP